jgi:hypothetical protein
MRRRRWLLFALAIVAAGGVYHLAWDDTNGERGRTEASTEFEPNKGLFTAIGAADQLTLYEGLPHPDGEEVLFHQERLVSRTVRFHGFPFYRSPLEVPAEDVARLKSLLGTEKTFLAWCGEKKCGGFHPDYLVEGHAGGEMYRVLICFGCGEVKVFGPTHALRCDMENDSRKQLKELLKKYRKNRPASEEL